MPPVGVLTLRQLRRVRLGRVRALVVEAAPALAAEVERVTVRPRHPDLGKLAPRAPGHLQGRAEAVQCGLRDRQLQVEAHGETEGVLGLGLGVLGAQQGAAVSEQTGQVDPGATQGRILVRVVVARLVSDQVRGEPIRRGVGGQQGRGDGGHRSTVNQRRLGLPKLVVDGTESVGAGE